MMMMTKDDVMEALEDQRENLLDAIEGLSDEQMVEPGVTGNWSVKDILYHLSLWEADLVKRLWQFSQNEKPTYLAHNEAEMHALNEAWFRQGLGRPLERVLDDLAAVRKQTVRRVASLPDRDFEAPPAWLKKPSLGEWIGEDSFKHEAEHAEQIREWRKQRGY